MSRSGYSEDYDGEGWETAMWSGRIASAARGKRGQEFFRSLVSALERMPEKRLIEEDLEKADGSVCALGALGKSRGVDMKAVDTEDWSKLGTLFNIAPCLAQEVMYQNDEGGPWRENETPERRWERVHAWAIMNCLEPKP